MKVENDSLFSVSLTDSRMFGLVTAENIVDLWLQSNKKDE
jgi:hypothetical protein